MVNSYIPKRGDAIWLDFNPQTGREQAGWRPAFVVSPANYNGKVDLALLCPITSRIKGYPFEVVIPEGFAMQGVVLSDQLKSLDWRSRHADFICTLPDSVAQEVLKKVMALFR
jgi:mRNA interferase MazF